jgi:predicted dehydrogenase
MITVAIIGAGIGRQHLDGYRALPHLFRVKVVCDLDLARAKEIVGTDPIAVTSNLDAVLADPDIELINVCLPPHLHFAVAKQALEAKKYTICEKPLVSSLADVDALIEVAKTSGKTLYPVFQYRYGPAMAALQALAHAGLTGTAYAASVQTHWCRGTDYYDNDWRGTWAGENGGAVLGHAIHNHDLITCVMGPIARVSAFASTRVNDIETEDCAAISMQMDSGALVTSSITLGAAHDTSRLQLCFEKLTATSGTEPYNPAIGDWTFAARDPKDQRRVDEVVASVQGVRAGYEGYFEAIAMDLAGQAAQVVTSGDGRRSIELVAAVYHAARTGSVVDLPLTKKHPLYNSLLPSP